jgi:hypothetical protein
LNLILDHRIEPNGFVRIGEIKAYYSILFHHITSQWQRKRISEEKENQQFQVNNTFFSLKKTSLSSFFLKKKKNSYQRRNSPIYQLIEEQIRNACLPWTRTYGKTVSGPSTQNFGTSLAQIEPGLCKCQTL